MASADAQSKVRRLTLGTLPFLLLLAVVIYEFIQQEYWLLVGVMVYIGVQIITAGWVYYDAKTRGVENAQIWYLAILLPVLGILALPVYLSSRKVTDEE